MHHQQHLSTLLKASAMCSVVGCHRPVLKSSTYEITAIMVAREEEDEMKR
jgi:hypothetical protein